MSVWGRLAIFGHFGIDLTGPTGGVVRVEDIVIEDVTSVFLRNMMDVVDVQDYGAIGDGITDNVAAFEAANAAATGRDVLVPEGTYHLATTVPMNNRLRFEGTIDMPDAAIFQLTKDFCFHAYEEAFGDETLALKKGLQALFNFTDHETFDLGVRTVNLYEPLDVYQAVGNRDTFAARRLIKNGELRAQNTAAWDTEEVAQTASYDISVDRKALTNVTNIATIKIGFLVEGTGVGCEIGLEVAQRQSIGFNINTNDAKIRNNRAIRFKHFCVLSSAGYIITGNY